MSQTVATVITLFAMLTVSAPPALAEDKFAALAQPAEPESYEPLTGEGLSGSAFIIQYDDRFFCVSSMHQFGRSRPKTVSPVEGKPIQLGDTPLVRRDDVLILPVTGADEPFEYLPASREYEIANGDELFIPRIDGPPVRFTFKSALSASGIYRSTTGPFLRPHAVDTPFAAQGMSGSPVIHAKSGRVIGVMTGADSATEATSVILQALRLPPTEAEITAARAQPVPKIESVFGITVIKQPAEDDTRRFLQESFAEPILALRLGMTSAQLAQARPDLLKPNQQTLPAHLDISEFIGGTFCDLASYELRRGALADIDITGPRGKLTRSQVPNAIRWLTEALGPPKSVMTADWFPRIEGPDAVMCMWENEHTRLIFGVHTGRVGEGIVWVKVQPPGRLRLNTQNLVPVSPGVMDVRARFAEWAVAIAKLPAPDDEAQAD